MKENKTTLECGASVSLKEEKEEDSPYQKLHIFNIKGACEDAIGSRIVRKRGDTPTSRTGFFLVGGKDDLRKIMNLIRRELKK